MRLRAGKWRACGSSPMGCSLSRRPLGGDVGGELPVLGRVDVVHAAGHHGHGAGGERGRVGRRVHPAGEARDDEEARLSRAPRRGSGPCGGPARRRCGRPPAPRSGRRRSDGRRAPRGGAGRRGGRPGGRDRRARPAGGGGRPGRGPRGIRQAPRPRGRGRSPARPRRGPWRGAREGGAGGARAPAGGGRRSRRRRGASAADEASPAVRHPGWVRGGCDTSAR
jgi:translation initiation factor IF-2